MPRQFEACPANLRHAPPAQGSRPGLQEGRPTGLAFSHREPCLCALAYPQSGSGRFRPMTVSLLVAALMGILAGVIHALSGPDHLSAVAPLVINERSRRWRMGLFWGIGHSLGVWIIGLVALVLRGFLPIESLSSWSERL